MGGSTGRTKDKIIVVMYEAEQHGGYATVSEMSRLIGLGLSTISEHLRDLCDRFGYTRECVHLRGRWELTDEGRAYGEALCLSPMGIEYYGVIAAGPAVPIMEAINEPLEILNLDPSKHFAMQVRGDSMVGYGILDGDLAIFRRVSTWLEVSENQIVAARVPEGTGADDEDWIGLLEQRGSQDGAQAPSLDHVTLKRFDARFSAYVRQGIEGQQAVVKLHGSKGTLRPTAVAVAGVLLYTIRDHE